MITIEVFNKQIAGVIHLLDEQAVARSSGSAYSSHHSLSYVATEYATQLANDASEATWEEIELSIAHESNMTANMLGVMLISGMLAVFGLANGAFELVLGAMLIAPGFEPLIRISLGIVTRSRAWRRGAINTLLGYGSLLGGAMLATIILRMNGVSIAANHIVASAIVKYWSELGVGPVLASGAAAAAGSLLIASSRPVLTAGVMVAMALIPSGRLLRAGPLKPGSRSRPQAWCLDGNNTPSIGARCGCNPVRPVFITTAFARATRCLTELAPRVLHIDCQRSIEEVAFLGRCRAGHARNCRQSTLPPPVPGGSLYAIRNPSRPAWQATKALRHERWP